MSGIFRTIFGGPSKQRSTSSSTSNYSNASGNLAFGPLSAAFSPTLGYTSSAGSMMASLLGLPQASAPAPTPTPTPSIPNPINPNPIPSTGPTRRFPGIDGGLVGRPGRIGRLRPDEGDIGHLVIRDNGPVGQINRGPVATSNPPANTGMEQSDALEKWADSAGMRFILNQGTKAIESSQAGRRMLQSGATGKALTQFGQDVGSRFLQQYMDNLLNHSRIGLGAGQVLSSAGGVSAGSGSSSSTGNSKGEGEKKGLLPMIASAIAGAA